MQIIQLILVLAAIGLNTLVYSEIITAYRNCEDGSCGASHLLAMFTAPIIILISIVTFVVSRNKLASETATDEQKKSARLIKALSLASLALVILPLFLLPQIILVLDLIQGV